MVIWSELVHGLIHRYVRVYKFVLSTEGSAAQSKLWTETMELLKSEAPNAVLGEF